MFLTLHFSPTVTNRFFFLFILFISLISSHSLTLQLLSLFFFFSAKVSTLSLIPSQSDFYLLFHSQLLSQILSSPSMAAKSQKSSYVLSIDILHLIRWNGAVRLSVAPFLTYKSQQYISEGVRTGSVSFSNFPHFSSFPLIRCFNLFLHL